MCYQVLLDPNEKLYTLDYYLGLAENMVKAGAHILAIKDMAGLLRPAAASKLVTALRENFDLPVHLHTHDTSGGQLATLLAASEAGVDAVDTAIAALAGTTSQVSMSALVAATDNTERETGLCLEHVAGLEPYWEAVRKSTHRLNRGCRHQLVEFTRTRSQVVSYQPAPAGYRIGLGERFESIETCMLPPTISLETSSR